MIILITGVPGAGKTLFAVSMLEKYVQENEEKAKKGEVVRTIYADIDGLTIPGVLPSPDDWTTVPDGSIVFYDECQQRFGPDGMGRSGRNDIQQMEVHRHRGIDLVLITQHPKLLHAHIRRLVGKHYHVFRMFGGQTAKIFNADRHIDIDKAQQLHQADNFMWNYPKELYTKYKSATVHTHKRHLPAWLKRSGIAVAALGVLVIYFAWTAKDFFTGTVEIADAKPREIQPEIIQAQANVAETVQPERKNCIWSDTLCRCYDFEGRLIEETHDSCSAGASEPWKRITDKYSTTSAVRYVRP